MILASRSGLGTPRPLSTTWRISSLAGLVIRCWLIAGEPFGNQSRLLLDWLAVLRRQPGKLAQRRVTLRSPLTLRIAPSRARVRGGSGVTAAAGAYVSLATNLFG